MNWKDKLRALERAQQWDDAIEFMEEVLIKNPDSVDAYLYMNYLLVNLLVNEIYDVSKHSYYEQLTKKYFDESYEKFSSNAEYLYYTAVIVSMAPWFVGLDDDEYKNMEKRALELEPNNILYQSNEHRDLATDTTKNTKKYFDYVRLILKQDSLIQKQLGRKGELGEYVLGMLEHRAKHALGFFNKSIQKKGGCW